jgi:hypothetical protein
MRGEIKITLNLDKTGSKMEGLPPHPDAGFIGRDENLEEAIGDFYGASAVDDVQKTLDLIATVSKSAAS